MGRKGKTGADNYADNCNKNISSTDNIDGTNGEEYANAGGTVKMSARSNGKACERNGWDTKNAWNARNAGNSMNGKVKRLTNLTGMRFGKLVAIEPTEERKNGFTVWKCRCDCGNTAMYPSRHLKNGWATSCGCTEKPPRYEDLTGQRFGKLVVIGVNKDRDERGRVVWDCVCDCGGHALVPSGQLKNGYRKSCGCLIRHHVKDWVGQSFGNLTVIAYDGKRKGKHYRRCRCICGNEVSISQSNLKIGHSTSCGCKNEFQASRHFVEGTCIESIRNNTIPKNNTSGVRGVYRNKVQGKWRAQITFKGKTKYLGSYGSLQEAAEARRKGEEVFREFLKRYDKEHMQEQMQKPG